MMAKRVDCIVLSPRRRCRFIVSGAAAESSRGMYITKSLNFRYYVLLTLAFDAYYRHLLLIIAIDASDDCC